MHDFSYVHNRKGTYCTQWDYIEDRFGKANILPFSISDTDFSVPIKVKDDLMTLVDRGIYGYTRWNHDEFKGCISNWYKKRFGCDFNNDWIAYSPSVMYSISILVRLTTSVGAKVLALAPMYDSFPGVIEGNQRKLVKSSLVDTNEGFKINFDELDELASQCEAFLLCSPHNPCGRIWSEEEILKIIDICKKHDMYLITDEIHMDIALGDIKHHPALCHIDNYPKIVTCSSSSKTFNTPALIGSYLIIPDKQLRDDFENVIRRVDFLNSASLLGMQSTITAYNECDDYVDEMCEYVLGNMQYIKDFLEDLDCGFKLRIPEGTYLAWIDYRQSGFTSDELQNALVNVGDVAIMKGETYGNEGLGYLRMCVGCPRSKVEEGMKRLKKAVLWLKDKDNEEK